MNNAIYLDHSNNTRDEFSQNGPATIILPDSKPISMTGLMAAVAGNRMLQNTANEAVREHCKALLVKSALDNVAALSAFEAHLQCIAPSGSERYRMILDAYSISLAMRLAGR